MGLILVMIVGVAFLFIGLPAALLGRAVLRKSEREGAFAPACWTALIASAGAQYAFATAPMIRTGKADFELFILPLFGWHLAPPLLLAVVIWLAARKRKAPVLHGVAVGLLFSIAALIVLSIPLGIVIPQVFGLRFTP